MPCYCVVHNFSEEFSIFVSALQEPMMNYFRLPRNMENIIFLFMG